MIDNEEDEWLPELKQKDSILNRIFVNFTNKSIKKKNIMEELMEDEIFKNIQKHGQEFYTKDLTQNNYSEDDEPENLMFDKAQIKENLKAHLKEENLYDPLLDSKEEEWTKTNLKKDKKSTTVLSCPYCFTQVCYDCQRHETFENQYRAIFARNCKINCTKTINPITNTNKNKENVLSEEEQLEELKEKCRNYFAVECCVCNTEVGVYEADEKIYYFFHIIPGLG